MVGDLVYIHEPECKGHRIDAIDELDGQVGADGEVYDECDIRPIPLTEEILVKNGFRIQVTDDNSKWLWVTDNSWLAYSKRHNYWYYEDMKITYIHQLQHLLRLVGVQKEIELCTN